MKYSEMSKEQLEQELQKNEARLEEMKEQHLSLDLSRGKPDQAQLDLSMAVLDALKADSVTDSGNGLDCRNYGALDGIPEAKSLFAEILQTTPEHVFVGGNSSLTLMFEVMSHAMIDGLLGEAPQIFDSERKFLCPVPGYDRHFGMTEHFGYKLISVPMKEDGPDMDVVEELVHKDPSIKGIWCVPKYANPTGVVYSDEVVKRFAALKPAARDFRIYWDNAYAVHVLDPEKDQPILDILSECEKAGNPDMVYEFTSTSKISFAGGGVAALASSPANLIDIKSFMTVATIGYDKLNMLRHVRYFKNLSGIKNHMAKHAALIRPKFEAVEAILEEELGGLGIAEWTKPDGGYFISFNTTAPVASNVTTLCKECGVIFTPAGATFPYGKDPNNSNIRIAPTYAVIDDIKTATRLFTIAVKVETLKNLLGK